jgi:hypothetical protein
MIRTSVSAQPPANLVVKVLRGEAFLDALKDDDFVQDFNDLFERCSWATPYQSLEFVKTWWKCYGDLFEPIGVFGYSTDGRLAAVFPLAVSKNGSELIPVGGTNSTYVSWLANESCAEQFIEATLTY